MPAFVALAISCLGFCLSTVDPNVAQPQLFPSRRENVWTSRKHIFCSRLPSRTFAPTFHASPSPFSLICRRTWCSLVTPLHCDPTSHAHYVRLPAAGLPWRSRVLYATWRVSSYLWIAMCIRAHLAHVAVEISDHSPNFLDTPCKTFYVCALVGVLIKFPVVFELTNQDCLPRNNHEITSLNSNPYPQTKPKLLNSETSCVCIYIYIYIYIAHLQQKCHNWKFWILSYWYREKRLQMHFQQVQCRNAVCKTRRVVVAPIENYSTFKSLSWKITHFGLWHYCRKSEIYVCILKCS